MTVADILAQVKTDIDQGTDSGRFSDADLLNLLNEGYRDFCNETGIRVKVEETILNQYDSLLSLDDDFVESIQIRVKDTQQIFPTSERKLDYDSADWRFEVGTPDRCVYFDTNVIRMVPILSAAATIEHRHSYIPTDLTSTDTPDFAKVYHDAMVDYVDSQCFLVLREYENAGRAWASYLKRRDKAKAQAKPGQRTPDTFVTQRPMTVFNYENWTRRTRP